MIVGIVAVDKNGAIGKGGRLPWHYSADMKFFKSTTSGHACVMGHKTWLTLKGPLPNRLNIVLSRKAQINSEETVRVVRDPESALRVAKDQTRDLFVIGGAEVYRAFLPYIDKWIVTEVPLAVHDADTFMPNNYLDGFVETSSQHLDDGLIVRFYERAEK